MKTSFVEKVLSLIQGGDESKIKRFHKKIVKAWKNQIRIRKDEIEKLKEQIEDKNEELSEAIFNVDVSQIQTTESTDAYVETYSQKINKINVDLDSFAKQIDVKNTEIKQFEDLVNLVS